MTNKQINIVNGLYFFNLLGIMGIFALLTIALVLQFAYQELPCPLCLLQRAGFLITTLGFLLNLRFGLKSSHYSIALLGALLTVFTALRQVALHVVPGTGSYGSAIFGLHLYTWSFIAAMALVAFISIILGVDKQYSHKVALPPKLRHSFSIVFIMIFLLTIANIVSVLMTCGIKRCPDNPVQYQSL